jgi:quercetin dioxygenase-like cupin family protein
MRRVDVIRTRPETQAAPADWFTGTIWIDTIAGDTAPSRLRAASVHFAPGARTAWHRHPNGQVLLVVEGVGLAQERGGAVQEIRAGDTVLIPAGEWHWHGAAPNNFMTHVAMHEVDEAGNAAEWGEHVTDAEYLAGT